MAPEPTRDANTDAVTGTKIEDDKAKYGYEDIDDMPSTDQLPLPMSVRRHGSSSVDKTTTATTATATSAVSLPSSSPFAGHEANPPPAVVYKGCQSYRNWDRERWMITLMGCTSSTVVLVVRLWLDSQPLAYLLHSIIVFLDMVLIHIFTHSRWLSICGELTTVAMFLAYHFTHETLVRWTVVKRMMDGSSVRVSVGFCFFILIR